MKGAGKEEKPTTKEVIHGLALEERGGQGEENIRHFSSGKLSCKGKNGSQSLTKTLGLTTSPLVAGRLEVEDGGGESCLQAWGWGM